MDDDYEEIAEFYWLDYDETGDHDFLKTVVESVNPRHVLEIPCGWGRNVVPILGATAGRVTFIDLSEPMTAQTRARIPASDRARARVLAADMRAVDLAAEFDLVICPRETIQMLDRADAGRALRSLGACMTDDGLIVVDLFAFTQSPAPRASAPPDYFEPREHGWQQDWIRNAPGLSLTRRRRQWFTPSGVHIEYRYLVQAPLRRSEPRSIGLSFDMTNYHVEDFTELARDSGLEVLATFAGYHGAAATASDPRTVFVLGRQPGQDNAERVRRLRRAVGADGLGPERDRADAG